MQMIFDSLSRNAARRPDDISFSGKGDSLTWKQLVHRVADLATRLDGAPNCVAIGVAGGCDYVVADLALSLTGRRQVPLPFFFSPQQIAHILSDAQVEAVITDRPQDFGPLPTIDVTDHGTTDAVLPQYSGGAERVIYTSGSSGRPKGVVIGERQLTASLMALLPVTDASETDRHLSILPLAQLLEQLCGIYLPILAGAETRFDFAATRTLFEGDIGPLSEAFARERPTTGLLVPGLLSRWLADLQQREEQAPDSLRFVATGGAASSPALLRQAQARGVPVIEGYGLSECCAVVAMNRPDNNLVGTAGPVLDGLDVQIINGEVTVAGPTVMEGYLNGPRITGRWRTGDMGRIENGRLIIEGRKDALLVTPAGRNISPEWIEQRVNADPRVVASALGLRQDGVLVLVTAVAAPVPIEEIAAALSDLPGYARPVAVLEVSAREPGLLFPAGTPNRAVAAEMINSRGATPLTYRLESLAS